MNDETYKVRLASIRDAYQGGRHVWGFKLIDGLGRCVYCGAPRTAEREDEKCGAPDR